MYLSESWVVDLQWVQQNKIKNKNKQNKAKKPHYNYSSRHWSAFHITTHMDGALLYPSRVSSGVLGTGCSRGNALYSDMAMLPTILPFYWFVFISLAKTLRSFAVNKLIFILASISEVYFNTHLLCYLGLVNISQNTQWNLLLQPFNERLDLEVKFQWSGEVGEGKGHAGEIC